MMLLPNSLPPDGLTCSDFDLILYYNASVDENAEVSEKTTTVA